MFSCFRLALRRPPTATRSLSTALTDSLAPAAASVPPTAVSRPSATTPIHDLKGTSSSSSVVASPIIQPVYLSMSSLIPAEEDATELDEVVELDPFVFDHPIRRDVLHLCVVQYLDSLRQGSANTKTRGQVRGSGRKIRPQKGTGKARLGDGQSPMLRGGGRAFGPKPRDFSTKLPRKVIQMGMRVALSARLQEHGLGVVRSLEWPGFKTKDFAERLEELGWKRTLFVTGHDQVPDGLRRVTSNLYKVESKSAQDFGGMV
ncbi:unnamed protein product [Somion occarium]|uniref:Large ribosomal subunit protein uL4m n=1 Tax=Somion occarium TaxID=3059160 RepID=A0ABP1CNE6_9APHY